MGFKKNWEVGDITSQVHSLAREISSPYNDGFIQWNCKQDLYQIKQLVDQALSKSRISANWKSSGCKHKKKSI